MSVEARRMKNLPVSILATRPRNRAAVSILAFDWDLKGPNLVGEKKYEVLFRSIIH